MKKVYWFTGQPGAGKTELANCLRDKLTIENVDTAKIVVIDGDDIRSLYHNTDYSIQGRRANVDFVQKLCSFLIKNDITPIVCMVSPFACQRHGFISKNDGVEIFVHCNEIRGREKYHVEYFERPVLNSKAIEINTTSKTVQQSFEELWKTLNH